MRKLFIALMVFGLCLGAHAGVSIVYTDQEPFFTPGGSFGTGTFVNVSANADDMIVITEAGNKKGSAVPLTLTQTGGTGATEAPIKLFNDIETYPTSFGWYMKATASGTFTYEVTTDNNAGLTAILQIYVLRAGGGEVSLADHATWDDTDTSGNDASYALNYTFSTNLTDAVAIETVSCRHDSASNTVGYTEDHTAGSSGKKQRYLASFVGVSNSTWSSTYTVTGGDVGKQSHGALGMVFADLAAGGGGTPGYDEVPLTSSNLYVQGAKFVNIDGNGMNFHRLDFTVSYSNVNAVKAKTTTGVKLTFYTDSPTIKLSFDYMAADENRNSRFGLYQNGVQMSDPYFAKTETSIEINIPSTGGAGEVIRHDVVLPNWSNPILSKMEIESGKTLLSGNPYPAKKMVVLGDSISHGTGQGASYQTYPNIAADRMNVELFNMAVGGGKIAPEVADLLQHFAPVDAVWILAGYNDWQGGSETTNSISTDYEALLASVRTHQPDAEVFCCTLTFTHNTNDVESGVTDVEVRQAVSDIVNARISAGDSKLHLIQGDDYSDATFLKPQPDNDVVHFTEIGAAMFATNVVSLVGPRINPIVSPQQGTNILFIAIDDINPVLGAYGDTLAITPRMDALAASGLTFLNAHCQWSVCGPSRASLMTGIMPEETGVMGFKKMRGDAVDSSRVNAVKRPNVVTIPQYFRYNGYRTTAVGKINDNRCVGSMDVATKKVAEDGNTVDDPPSWGEPVNSGVLPADFFTASSFVSHAAGFNSPGKPATYATNLADNAFNDGIICDDGITLLQNLATNDTQFFLGVGFKKPHLPFEAPQHYWDLYDRNDFEMNPFQDHPLHEVSYTWNYAKELESYDDFNPTMPGYIPATNIPADKQKELLHGYYACVSFIDAQVGRLLDELEAQGLHTNTIVVLWGDHGFHLGDHAEWAKHTNLERATRVPFIIRNPFGGQVGATTETPVGLIDLYPTLCELAGLPLPQQPLNENEEAGDPASGRSLKGHSLAGVVNGTENSVRTGAVNLFSRDGHNGYAYRTDRYRYTEWVNKSSNVVTARELYDYVNDPMETINLAGEPGFDALMYQFSKSMRKEFDDMKLSGNDVAAAELQGSPAATAPVNRYLPVLDGSETGMDVNLIWPDAAGSNYNVLQKTNLLDAVWMTNQIDVAGSPATVPADEQQSFFRIEVSN